MPPFAIPVGEKLMSSGSPSSLNLSIEPSIIIFDIKALMPATPCAAGLYLVGNILPMPAPSMLSIDSSYKEPKE